LPPVYNGLAPEQGPNVADVAKVEQAVVRLSKHGKQNAPTASALIVSAEGSEVGQ